MKHHILKLALGLLALGALGFAGYRFMQQRDNVEIQSVPQCKNGYRLCKGQGVPTSYSGPQLACVPIGSYCENSEGG